MFNNKTEENIITFVGIIKNTQNYDDISDVIIHTIKYNKLPIYR